MRPEHWLYTIPLRLRSLFRWAQADQELDDELRDHLDRKTEEYVAQGMAPEEARRRARLELGGVEKVKEECRYARRVTWTQDLSQDIRYGLRMLAKQPGFTAIAVLTLALGIGANTAIFSVINAVLLRPLPYPNAGRIMVLNESSGPGQDFSVALPDYFDWQKESKTFEHLACTHKESRNLSGIPGREAERVSTASVTRNFFNIIGLSPQIGRVFSEDEDKVGAPPVAIISDRIWQRVFNRSPKAIGQSIVLHDQNFTVIGVMPPQLTSPQDTDVWASLMRRSNNPAWIDRS